MLTADRATSRRSILMQITDVKHFLTHPGRGKNLCFVKVETDEGIHGWGESYTQADRDLQIVAHIDQLKRYLIGRDPRNIKHFMQMVYDDFAGRRGAMDLWCAVSGIEHAMWDITAKKAGMPVHMLLGGACRSKIRVYANGWGGGSQGPEQLAEKAQQVVEMGFTAMKLDPIPGPWRTYVGKDVEDAAIENVRAVREAVGWDVDILIEMHRRLAPMHARRIGREIERYRPFWYEEPILAENVDALAAVKRDINLPVVTGEELYTKFEFREIFEKQAADIINPDVCNVGGILELKEIAAMAEPYFVAVSPHNFNSTTVGLAATMQVSATIPNFLITEYFVNLEEFGEDIAINPFKVEDGYIQVPDQPGIGIELDEDKLAAYPYRPFDARSPRQYHEEGP
jgi:galactonate dehydratase|tara:strand:+ start:450 stop:1643 length:1194 start_codon:yes stop_codon:yes gene_type:complete